MKIIKSIFKYIKKFINVFAWDESYGEVPYHVMLALIKMNG